MRAQTSLLALLLFSVAAAAGGPPARVADQHLEVVVDSHRHLQTHTTWKVRIDDPAATTAGLPAPPGLDGASGQGAMVMGDLLVVPGGTAPGSTFTLASSDHQSRGPWSGVFLTAADLPVGSASARVQVPSWVDATVWFDHGAQPTFERTRYSRAVRVGWTDLPADTRGELVWTTWKSWDEAGDALRRLIDPKLADKETLGAGLARDIEGATVADLVDRVDQAVHVSPEDYGTWKTAKAAADVVAAGQGTAADRGVVLISMLRVAGYDARPALFRPLSAGAAAPLVVPAPSELTRPAVAVVSAKRVLWIDPASRYTTLPDLPASMTGAVAWAPGRLPVPLADQGVMDGMITVNGRLQVEPNGDAAWQAQISASGTAREWLRSRLAPLDPKGRESAILRLVREGRPKLERFQVSMSGLENPQRPLQISLQGHDEHAVQELGPGTKGTIPPLVAPGLAGWLPTRILVHEEVAIDTPSEANPVAMVPATPTYHEGVVLARHLRRNGHKLVLVTEAQRPVRHDTPARAADAAAFLAKNASTGPQILWFGLASPQLAKAVRSDPRFGSPVERTVTEVLLWLSADDLPHARAAFKKALVDESPDSLARQIRRYATPGDARPWSALYDASRVAAARIVAAEGLAGAGADREAWLDAADLAADPDPAVQVRALRLMYRLQPEQQPDAKLDPAGNAAWKPRQTLLTRAHEASRTLSGNGVGGDAAILLTKARRDLDHGRPKEAIAPLERILAAGPNPVARVLHARARATLGVAAQDLVDEIERGVRAAPFDAGVLAEAARAMAAVGRNARAESYGLSAARLAFVDPTLWGEATQYAIAAGDLPTAAYTARRASDLAPKDPKAAETLLKVATWIGDRKAATIAATRDRAAKVPKWPSTFDEVLQQTPPNALLAVLQYYQEQVAGNPQWLVTRAQLRLDAGLLDGAARDGVLLATRHGDPRGEAIAFAATAGRLWTSRGTGMLKDAATNEQVRATRMEYALITGDGDALADARVLAGDDPRAAVLVQAATAPGKLVAGLAGWPTDLKDPTASGPRGWKANALLGAAPGIIAWSHPDLASAVLLVASPDDAFPPPLAELYTPHRPDEASLPGGGRLVLLDGGNLRVFAATRAVQGKRVWALAFTSRAARRALEAMTTALAQK